jgi:hypothetical protein
VDTGSADLGFHPKPETRPPLLTISPVANPGSPGHD